MGIKNVKNGEEECQRFRVRVAALKSGERQAWDGFYSEYGPMIAVTARSVCLNREDAEEVIDDVLYKIWRDSDKIAKMEKPIGWLYTITVNCAKDKIKSRAKHQPLVPDLGGEERGFDLISEEDAFVRTIRILSAREREILTLRFLRDLTLREIAQALHLSVGAVNSAYYGALKKLEKKFRKEDKKERRQIVI